MSAERTTPSPRERRIEHRRVARQAELLERLARRARERVEQEGLAVLVDDVVEERAELRALTAAWRRR